MSLISDEPGRIWKLTGKNSLATPGTEDYYADDQIGSHYHWSTGLLCQGSGSFDSVCPEGCGVKATDHWSNDGHKGCEDIPDL